MRNSPNLVDRARNAPQSGAHPVLEAYRRHGVPHQVDEGRGGWISTHCPHCAGSQDYHLGFSVAGNFYKCWRCGTHLVIDTLVALGLSRDEAAEIYRALGGSSDGAALARRDREAQSRVGLSRYRHPDDVGPMAARYRRYLERRRFDPDRIGNEWGVLGTGPASYLDDGNGRLIDYRYRLLIPIRWDGGEVSFQTRDVTDKSDKKYVACPTSREVRHHKSILYGRQERWGEVGIIVEGVTDVWRLGPRAAATFGIAYTDEQVREIYRRFQRVAIVFDPEPQARRQAVALKAMLWPLMREEPIVVDLGKGLDPGSMAQDDADHLVRELTR